MSESEAKTRFEIILPGSVFKPYTGVSATAKFHECHDHNLTAPGQEKLCNVDATELAKVQSSIVRELLELKAVLG